MSADQPRSGRREPYTATAYTPAYEAYLLNLVRMSSPLLAFDVAGLQDHAIVYHAPNDIGRHGGREHHPVMMAREVLLQWQVVGLVTITEAYLQDALAFVAERDASIMKDSEQTATYASVLQSASLEELAAELRTAWARRFLERAGPATWIQRLERIGVRGCEENDGEVLEQAWGVRHAIVHAAGSATRDFVQRHPSYGAQTGEPLAVTRAQLGVWLEPVVRLCESMERYCFNRFLRTPIVSG